MTKRALISVSDKTNIVEFAKGLEKYGFEIISTGGTFTYLKNNGVACISIEDVTHFPEILEGRVKTLHPKIHGGLLSKRGNELHNKHVAENNIEYIDLVCVNLYPFEATVKKEGVSEEEIIENIDIGGPSMLRSAAKNFNDVTVVTDIRDYDRILNELENGGITLATRRSLAIKVFNTTASYDAAIANYFNKADNLIPEKLTLSYTLEDTLRYGENPHQKGIFFGDFDKLFTKLHGKELSYNNLLDVDAAVNLMSEFAHEAPTFAILKHNNTCGIASRSTILEAYETALACDPVSAFGGILIANRTIDKTTAEAINPLFCEVIIAPDYEKEAIEILETKKNRIILKQKDTLLPKTSLRSCLNGYLWQDKDLKTDTLTDITYVTEKHPTTEALDDLLFASKICKHTKSNTIVLVKNKQLLASGTGQTSRVDALKQAIEKAKEFKFSLQGAVMASDAFFPFPDCVEIAHKEGIKDVIQPGGSIKDNLSIEYCNEHQVAMVFTGIRHFKH